MTENTDESPSRQEADGRMLGDYSRRELVGLVVVLWLTGSLSDLRTLLLAYGLQGYGRFGYGGSSLPEYRNEGTRSRYR